MTSPTETARSTAIAMNGTCVRSTTSTEPKAGPLSRVVLAPDPGLGRDHDNEDDAPNNRQEKEAYESTHEAISRFADSERELGRVNSKLLHPSRRR